MGVVAIRIRILCDHVPASRIILQRSLSLHKLGNVPDDELAGSLARISIRLIIEVTPALIIQQCVLHLLLLVLDHVLESL